MGGVKNLSCPLQGLSAGGARWRAPSRMGFDREFSSRGWGRRDLEIMHHLLLHLATAVGHYNHQHHPDGQHGEIPL